MERCEYTQQTCCPLLRAALTQLLQDGRPEWWGSEASNRARSAIVAVMQQNTSSNSEMDYVLTLVTSDLTAAA